MILEIYLNYIAAHVCQVFAIHGIKLEDSTVQKFIDYKLANIKAIGSEIKK